MTAATLSDKAILASLKAHPGLRDRFASIIEAIENSEGNFKEADAVEERIVEEMRLLGREAMQGWAENQVEATEREIRRQAQMHRQGKKKLRWHTKFGEVAVLEPQYRFEKKRVRPFMHSAKVVSRGCSGPLQRAIVDFAADQPFALARAKLREHYGFEIGESTIQRVTLGHAGNMFEAGKISLDFPEAPGRHKDIVAETDGGMIPIVEPDARRFLSRTPRGAGRQSMPARSRAVSKPPDGNFSDARFEPASAPIPAFTRSGTERPGSWVRWKRNSAHKAAI